jgi:glycosyl transferase family 25
MRVHLINLERNPERLAEFKATNGHLGDLARVPAVDGEKLDLAALEREGLVSADVLKTYTMGAVGLALTHFKLWESAIASGDMVTIAEDDAIFNRNFETYADEVVKTLPTDWDMIVWGFNFDLFLCFDMLPGVSTCLAQFEQDRLRQGIEAFQSQSLDPRAFRLGWAFGTPCYTISPKGAQALRGKCAPLRPRLLSFPLGRRVAPFSAHYRTVGIDVLMNLFYGQLDTFVCIPPLVVTKNDSSKSTVQEQKAGGS